MACPQGAAERLLPSREAKEEARIIGSQMAKIRDARALRFQGSGIPVNRLGPDSVLSMLPLIFDSLGVAHHQIF